jgi:hypothetical protein
VIYGPVIEQGIWRIRTKQELWELCEDLDIVADLKKKLFRWVEHEEGWMREGQLRKILRGHRREEEWEDLV